MKILSLSLSNFRNYESQQVTFDGGLNVLHGKNASGKTNMIESVYLCSLLRSPRTTKDKELIRMGANSRRLMALTSGLPSSNTMRERGKQDLCRERRFAILIYPRRRVRRML